MYNNIMHYFKRFFFFFAILASAAARSELDSFYDEKIDYSSLIARITDRDKTGNILRIYSQNKNIRFFRIGDPLSFRMASRTKSKFCRGNVRSVEEHYFVIYVRDVFACIEKDEYFIRRGSMIHIKSKSLSRRIIDASTHRLLLLKRKKDLLTQLKGINNFLWSYQQHRIKLAVEYDNKLIAMKKEKQKALEVMLGKRRDSIILQNKIPYYLDQVEKDLEFYRIDNRNSFLNRWDSDHNLGLPMSKNMPAPKQVDLSHFKDKIEEF